MRNVNSSETRHPFSRFNTFNVQICPKFWQIFIKTKKWHLCGRGTRNMRGMRGVRVMLYRPLWVFLCKKFKWIWLQQEWFLCPHHSTGIHRMTNCHLQAPTTSEKFGGKNAKGNHKEPPTMSVATSVYLSVLEHFVQIYLKLNTHKSFPYISILIFPL